MKVTNRYDLPSAYVAGCSDQREHKRGVISVTELISPAQERSLVLQHWDEIEEDAADCIDRWFGTAVHAHLAAYAPEGVMAELQQGVEMLGWTVTGTPDHLDLASGELLDWKTSRVRGLTVERTEWVAQVNLYAHLLRLNGHEVTSAAVKVFCKDWDPALRHTDGYPLAPIVHIPLPLWDSYEAQQYLTERLRLHRQAARGFYPPCTPEEQWRRDVWVVTKKGNGRGRLFATEELAWQFAAASLDPIQKVEDWYDIELRRGDAMKCEFYCRAQTFCDQYRDENPLQVAVSGVLQA